jgi:PAS domain S-box-containing protein
MDKDRGKNIYLIGEIAEADQTDLDSQINIHRINELETVKADFLNENEIDMVIIDLSGDLRVKEKELILRAYEKGIFVIVFVNTERKVWIEELKLDILIYTKPISLKLLESIINTIFYCKYRKDKIIEINRYYMSYFNKSRVGMALRGLDGKFFNINNAFCKMLGYNKNELIGRTTDFFTHKDDFEKDRKMVQDLKNGKINSITNEKKYIRKDGKIVWGLLNLSIERGINNEPVYFFAQVQDITKLKFAEKQLRQASKMEAIGTLAGGIAHDFNNILGVIYGFSELVLDEIKEGSPGIKYIEKIISSADKAKDLIYQILKFSRGAETGNSSIKVTPIIKEFLKLLRAITPANISITYQFTNKSDLIFAEPMLFQQVLMHICTNANEAMKEDGGQLVIRVSDIELNDENAIPEIEMKVRECLMISICDTGKGIDCDVMNRIFDPYYSTSEKAGSSGLSLAITYQIVRDFGGSIQVNSIPGEGTTFNIFLPKIKAGGKEKVILERISLPGNESILLIDDEENLVEIGRKILQKMGYRVTAVTSSISAFNLFKENPEEYDLVISDMTMPEMTGLQLSRKLMKIKPEIPIIISTGYSNMINLENFKTLGISGLLMKPVGKDQLLRKVREILNLTAKEV